MKAPPESTKASLTSGLNTHARTRWPQLSRVEVRFRANFAYVDGHVELKTIFQTLSPGFEWGDQVYSLEPGTDFSR